MTENPRQMKARLSQSGIHCSLDWVTACIDWLAGEQPGLSTSEVLLKLQEQWLITDITTPGVMERPVLPPNLADSVKIDLPGQYSLQVQHGHDVGSPAYGQLQKLHQVDLENARVSADDSLASQAGQGGYQATQGGKFVQSWEPKPQRVMMLTISDGFQTVEAMEHQVIKAIPDTLTPGMKIQVLGPVTVRRGIILLTPNNVRVLGGEVEELQDQFGLIKILQQKIGKEDVGQKGNMFAQQSTNHPLQNSLHHARLHPTPTPAAASVPDTINFTDSMSDDDDMFLLAASQVDMSDAITSTQTETRPSDTKRISKPPVSSTVKKEPPSQHIQRSHQQVQSKYPPVGVVQPLRTITPSNTNQSSTTSNSGKPGIKKMKAQSSISSYLVSKASNISPDSNPISFGPVDSIPSFSLLDSDDEFLSDLPLPPSPPSAKVVPDEPFQYLINVKAALQAQPEKHLQAKLKVVSSTLASKMCLKKTPSGPQWQVAIMLNDGSDSIKADLSPHVLDTEIGSARQYVELGINQTHVKAEYKERMKKLSVKLADLSCLVTLQVEGSGSNPTIVKMEEITGLHTALMRKRSVSSDQGLGASETSGTVTPRSMLDSGEDFIEDSDDLAMV